MKRAFLLSVSLLLATTSYAVKLPQPHQTIIPIDKVAVIVNDSVITTSEINSAESEARSELQARGTPIPANKNLRRKVINTLINEALQKAMIKRMGLKVSDMDLNSAIANIANQNHLSVKQLRQQVVSQGISFAKYRRRIRQQMTFSQLQQQAIGSKITVSAQEISRFQSQNKKAVHPNAEYHIADILVPLGDTPTPRQIRQAKSKAAEIVKQLNGGASFAKIAAAQSGGNQSLKGGDLGWRRLAALPTIFSSHIAKIKINQIAGPLQAPNGFHVIKLLGIRGGAKLSDAQIRNLIYQRKFEEKVQTWLQQLRDSAYIKYS